MGYTAKNSDDVLVDRDFLVHMHVVVRQHGDIRVHSDPIRHRLARELRLMFGESAMIDGKRYDPESHQLIPHALGIHNVEMVEEKVQQVDQEEEVSKLSNEGVVESGT